MQNIFYPPADIKQTTTANRLQGLWQLMTGFHTTYIGSVMSIAVAALAKTWTYLLLRDFADNAIHQAEQAGDSIPIYYFALGFVGLALFEASFTFFGGKLAARATQGTLLRLRNFLFDHIQRLPFGYHDQTKTGELIQRATSDVDTINRFFSDQGTQVGRITMIFVINFIALLALNVQLALFSVAFIPVILIVSYFFFNKVNAIYQTYQEADAKLSTALQENLTGVRVVKAFARQAFETDKFETINRQKYGIGRRLMMMHALYWPVSDIVCGGQMLLVFYLGARMAIMGDITLGTYLAFANLVIWLIWPVRNLGRLITQASTGLVSYRRIADIIDHDQEQVSAGVHRAKEAIQGEVRFEGVSFHYDDHTPVLQNVTFTAKPGQVIALMGPTGSGKSSLINLLPRFYDYTTGRITLDDLDLREYAPETLRQAIGIVEQEPFLFSRTIRENIAYGARREVSDAEIEAATRAAAIHEVILTFPQGYDTMVGEKGVTLSGGQKQRLAIARTLLKDPKLLILDDSTSAVDTETEALIQQALDNLMQGRTTFIIAHRIQTIMRADQILVMQAGQIIQQGTHQDLMQQDGLYRNTYEVQAKVETEANTDDQFAFNHLAQYKSDGSHKTNGKHDDDGHLVPV